MGIMGIMRIMRIMRIMGVRGFFTKNGVFLSALERIFKREVN